jgi:hypothetical protein
LRAAAYPLCSCGSGGRDRRPDRRLRRDEVIKRCRGADVPSLGPRRSRRRAASAQTSSARARTRPARG